MSKQVKTKKFTVNKKFLGEFDFDIELTDLSISAEELEKGLSEGYIWLNDAMGKVFMSTDKNVPIKTVGSFMVSEENSANDEWTADEVEE